MWQKSCNLSYDNSRKANFLTHNFLYFSARNVNVHCCFAPVIREGKENNRTFISDLPNSSIRLWRKKFRHVSQLVHGKIFSFWGRILFFLVSEHCLRCVKLCTKLLLLTNFFFSSLLWWVGPVITKHTFLCFRCEGWETWKRLWTDGKISV